MQNLLKYWLATVVVIFGTINSASADLNDGLVACYGFEENTNDTSDNALHGTEHGGVSYTTGRIGKAASFDGVDDYIEVAHNDVLNPAQLSVAVWMNVFDVSQVTASHNHHMVFNKEGQYEMAAFGEPHGDAQTNELSFAFNPYWYWQSSGFFPNLDTFYHVVPKLKQQLQLPKLKQRQLKQRQLKQRQLKQRQLKQTQRLAAIPLLLKKPLRLKAVKLLKVVNLLKKKPLVVILKTAANNHIYTYW